MSINCSPMVLFLVFLVLKLTYTIDWSWVWVTCPLWATLRCFHDVDGCVQRFDFKGRIMERLIGFTFDFDGEDKVASSLESNLKMHEISVLFVLSTLSLLSVKNKKGVDLGVFAFILSEISDMYTRVEFQLLVGRLEVQGFLSSQVIGDGGDRLILISLKNSAVGDYAERKFLAEFPEFCDGMDRVRDMDVDKIRPIREKVEEDEKEVKH